VSEFSGLHGVGALDQWTGLLDWAIGLDYWAGLDYLYTCLPTYLEHIVRSLICKKKPVDNNKQQ